MDTKENTNMDMTPVNDEHSESVVDSGTTALSGTEGENQNAETSSAETEEIVQPETKVPAKRGRKKKVVEPAEAEAKQPADETSKSTESKVEAVQEEATAPETAEEPVVAEAVQPDAEPMQVEEQPAANTPEAAVTESIQVEQENLQKEDVAPEENLAEPVEEPIYETVTDEIVQTEIPVEAATEELIQPEAEHIEEKPVEDIPAAETTDSVQDEADAQPAKRGRKKKEEVVQEAVTEEPITDVEETVAELVTREELEGCNMTKLIEITESVLEHEDLTRIKAAMILLKSRFEALEHDYEQQVIISEAESKQEEEQEEPAEVADEFKTQSEHFRKLLNKYSKLRKQHNEKLEAEKLRNYDLKKQILEDLKQLIESEETLQKSWEDFKRLQQAWKEIGHVPPAQSQDLWNSFNHFVDLFLDKVKINRELRDLDYKKNLETKLEICEKVEELFLDESIDNAFKKLGELQSLWRETGPVPSEKREEINGRFNSAVEKLREKRREFYQSFKVELENNLEVKNALVLKMREINEEEATTAKAWGTNTEKVDELMQMWKNTGPVPRKHNEEIWKEFRQEMGRFYAEKKAYFGKIRDEQMENYNRKQLLCKQAESLQESSDWKKTTLELIAMQNEWKTIGPVPHRYSDNIWKQFRTACDVFFNRKKEYFSNIEKHEEENLKAKQELIEQMLTYEFGDDNRANLEAIKDFQRKFFDIGRVPLKEKTNIQSALQKAVDGLLEKLKIGKDEKRRFDMKQKYDHLGASKSGQGDIRKESFAISAKIGKLEADIQLWENNIEFFAKSKNADILTREFRDKIERAKAELLILKEKQKMMKDMINE